MTPPKHETPFIIFTRALPTMNITISGRVGVPNKMFIEACSMGLDISFTYTFPDGETIADSIQNIMLKAHEVAIYAAGGERDAVAEEGKHVFH